MMLFLAGVLVGLVVGVPAGLWAMAMAGMVRQSTLPELEGDDE